MLDKRKCVLCDNVFQPRNSNQIVCGGKHYFVCPVCGNKYEASSYHIGNYIKNGTIGCCSPKCRGKQGIQTKIKIYGKGNNGEKISNSLKNKSQDEREQITRKLKQTKLNRYGDENFVNTDKMKQTKLNRYGDENYNNIEQIKQTNLNKYGVDNVYQTQDVLDKVKQTNLSKYGVDNAFKSKQVQHHIKTSQLERYSGIGMGSRIIRAKIESTNLNRYGTKNVFGNKNIRAKINKTIQDKYGYNYYAQRNINEDTLNITKSKDTLLKYIENLPENSRNMDFISKDLNMHYSSLYQLFKRRCIDVNDVFIHKYSNLELSIKSLLDTNNIEYIHKDRKMINPLELDFYIPKHNVAIECNGTYWHSTKINYDKNYHYNKSKLCEERGIRLIHIFGYEWDNQRQRPILQNIINNALGINEHKLYARKLKIEIRPSKVMREFFDTNNIQGFRPGKFAICLVDKITNEVYMSYMMGNAFFGKGKYEWEVIRGATKLGYTVVGGASRIFKYFIDNYNPNNCVYYIDYNYFNGNSLKNMPDMNYIKTQLSYKNYWVNSGVVKNRDPIHHKEIKERLR